MVSTWSDGYVADVNYTRGVYREMLPQMMRFAALRQGVAVPDLNQPFTYCELGCGYGLTSAIVAANHPQASVYAVDFNPGQIAWASGLAKAAGLTNLTYSDASFAEYLETDLPAFDFIVLHGVYSWVSDKARAEIVEFLSRKLKPGGICYISYNCMPGWSEMAPIRKLLFELSGAATAPTMTRIQHGLATLADFKAANPGFLQAFPGAAARIDQLSEQPANYLAHEYLNESWTLFYHVDLARELARARLSFLCSAEVAQDLEFLQLTSEQQAFVKGVENPAVREMARDLCQNQQFRKDLFVRGVERASLPVQKERILKQAFRMLKSAASVELKATFKAGSFDMDPAVYGPILTGLDAGPLKLGELVALPALRDVSFEVILEAVSVLVAIAAIVPDAGPEGGQAELTCAQLNAALRSDLGDAFPYHASPGAGFVHQSSN